MRTRLPWMSLRDRRRWRGATTLAEVGELMALWLEGTLASRPGYAPRYGPDEETAHLVPTLAAACRAGLITTVSQPGLAGTGADGLWWEQRAAVTGLVTDYAFLGRLYKEAVAEGLVVLVNDHALDIHSEPYVVTTRDGEPYTAFGGPVPAEDLAAEWQGLHPGLTDLAVRGYHLTIAAPEWGAAGERLWPLLDRLTGLRPQNADGPWATA
ncbi:DUF6919 domain-containing protein [Streptomyces sp. NPDC088915]|uniref:DUF6919 domain-containing protein n=1 Tax=Streptomyces sp. NPDC088915 TaxID=3365912 RepID=UPI0037FED8B6